MVSNPVSMVDVGLLPSRSILETQKMTSLYAVVHFPHGQSIFELVQFHEPLAIS
jgi:hypothetical protein